MRPMESRRSSSQSPRERQACEQSLKGAEVAFETFGDARANSSASGNLAERDRHVHRLAVADDGEGDFITGLVAA